MGPKDPRRKSQVFKRSVKIGERITSVHLENAFWTALKGIAAAQGIPVSHLIATIDNERQHPNLSSAIRLFVLEYYRSRMPALTPGTAANASTQSPAREIADC